MNYQDKLNPIVRSLKPSGIRKFFDIVSEMPDALTLGIGEPDFVTPWEIRDAAIKSVQKGYTSYTSNRGLPELRIEIAGFLENRCGLSYHPDSEICVTIGASEAIDLTLRAILSPGDEVVMPDPSYVSYVPNVLLCGGVPVPVKTREEDCFKLTRESLEAAITPRTKLLILPYPNNPTGAIMTKEELLEIVPVIKKHDLIVLSDEIYAELTYGGAHVSIASLPGMRERTVLVSGFSKAFAMTGWRLGYVCAPKELMEPVVKIHQYIIMCAPTVSQYAALAALRTGKSDNYAVVREMRESYDMRRRFLTDAFRKMGLSCFEPLGAFYVFPSVAATNLTGEAFAEKLLKSEKVAVVPGSAFGESGSFHIRTCYACSMAVLAEAATRIERFLRNVKMINDK
ncbi:MAG: aminotransferase class I/II-fold pyridoxal phosphate-dependent enzyme [Firmicutes bacterium]|nr:aminotransferase class I/II-fold pyridoxal phosphate-dependent enzyme [Bacillota bacterium]